MNIITTTNNNKYTDERFNRDSREFTVHWNMGLEAARKAAIKLNDMVSGLHQQHKDWSFTKIAKTIWIKNQELEGFTTQTIRKKLDEDNLKLIDSSKYHPSQSLEELRQEKGELVQNNVMEPSVPTDTEQKVIEESSIPSQPVQPTYLKEELEEPEQVYDEDNPKYVDYLIDKYETKVSNAKHWIEHYHQEIQTLNKEIHRLKSIRMGME